MTLREKMELQDEIDRGGNDIIPDEEWEKMTRDEKFVEFVEKTFKELQESGEIYCNPQECHGACCKAVSRIGEPNVSEYEVQRIAEYTGHHPECFTKYIVPAEQRGLWKSFHLKPIKVIKRHDDPCLFLDIYESYCMKYKHACVWKKTEVIKAS